MHKSLRIILERTCAVEPHAYVMCYVKKEGHFIKAESEICRDQNVRMSFLRGKV